MAYGSIVEQLLRNPEYMIDGIINEIRKDVAEEIGKKWLEVNQAVIEQMVEEKLKRLRGFLNNDPSKFENQIDVRFFLDRKERPLENTKENG